MTEELSPGWVEDCLYWHGRILMGKKAHWCWDFDDLPIDETCEEMEFCHCQLQSFETLK